MGEEQNQEVALCDAEGNIYDGKVLGWHGELKTDAKGKKFLDDMRKEFLDQRREVEELLRKIVTDEVMGVNAHGMDSKLLAEVQSMQIDFGFRMAVLAWNKCIEYHTKRTTAFRDR